MEMLFGLIDYVERGAHQLDRRSDRRCVATEGKEAEVSSMGIEAEIESAVAFHVTKDSPKSLAPRGDGLLVPLTVTRLGAKRRPRRIVDEARPVAQCAGDVRECAGSNQKRQLE